MKLEIPDDLRDSVSHALYLIADRYRSDLGHDADGIAVLRRDADRLEKMAEEVASPTDAAAMPPLDIVDGEDDDANQFTAWRDAAAAADKPRALADIDAAWKAFEVITTPQLVLHVLRVLDDERRRVAELEDAQRQSESAYMHARVSEAALPTRAPELCVCGAPAERVAELERTLREVLATIPTSDEVATWDRIANDSDRTWSLEHAKRREERARKAAEAAAARAELERADSPEVREARDSAAAEALARAKDGDA